MSRPASGVDGGANADDEDGRGAEDEEAGPGAIDLVVDPAREAGTPTSMPTSHDLDALVPPCDDYDDDCTASGPLGLPDDVPAPGPTPPVAARTE